MTRALAILALAAALAGCVSNATIDAMNARHAAQIEQANAGAEQ